MEDAMTKTDKKRKASNRKRSTRSKIRIGTAVILIFAALLVLCVSGGYSKADDRVPLKALSGLPVINYSDILTSAKALKVSAESAVLIDANSGNVIYEYNAEKKLPMASTTKIMTALVAIENCPIDKTVTVTKQAVGIEGSSIYLYEGEKLRMEDLLYALLLESANDAATAIAIEVGGSVEGFAEMMNKKAKALGLCNTSFQNPHGLDNEEHYTTAHDLAIIAREALADPTLERIFSTEKKTIPLNSEDGVRLLINHNKLLRMYDGTIGVKTGYTKRSGRCLVSAAERDGVRLIAVTLNAPNDWKDHTEMLDYGFETYEYVMLCKKGEFSEPLYLVGGAEQYVTVSNPTEVGATLPRSHGEIMYKVELPSQGYAPVESGERLGRLIFYCDGRAVADTEIIAVYGVDRVKYRSGLWDRLKSKFD